MLENKEQTSLIEANGKQQKKMLPFLFSFIAVFAMSFLFFIVLGMAFSTTIESEENTAESKEIETTADESIATIDEETKDEQKTPVTVDQTASPVHIIIESVDIDSTILNPQSRDIAVLDAALKEGVVRYPGSGALGEKTNMFLFGHSTNWQVVQNPAYQSFNNLDKVLKNDIIRVQSDNYEYIYKVQSVTLVDGDEAWVSLADEQKLFISTCNTFGQKTERFVVEADFVGRYPFEQS